MFAWDGAAWTQRGLTLGGFSANDYFGWSVALNSAGNTLAVTAKEWGGTVHVVECLNTDEQWCKDFARYTYAQAEGSAQDKEDLEYPLESSDYEAMPPLAMNTK